MFICGFSTFFSGHNSSTDLGTSSHYRSGLPPLSHHKGGPLHRCPHMSWSDVVSRSHMSCYRDSSGSSWPNYLHLKSNKTLLLLKYYIQKRVGTRVTFKIISWKNVLGWILIPPWPSLQPQNANEQIENHKSSIIVLGSQTQDVLIWYNF